MLSWKNALKSAKLFSNIGLCQKSLFRLDDCTKQDSFSWMSKLFLKKRIIGIGLELVIFIKKKLSMVMSQFWFLRQKRWHIIRETKNSSFSSVVVLTKTGRSSKEVVGNFERPIPHYNWTHKRIAAFFLFKTFFCVQRIDKDNESLLAVKSYLVGSIQ